MPSFVDLRVHAAGKVIVCGCLEVHRPDSKSRRDSGTAKCHGYNAHGIGVNLVVLRLQLDAWRRLPATAPIAAAFHAISRPLF